MPAIGKKNTAKRILETAARLYGQYGPDAVGMRMLAAEVGVQPNTITHHFSSKENLRRKALAYALAHLVPIDEIIEHHPPVAGADKQSQADCLGAVIFDLAAAVAHARFEPYARMITHGILGPDTEQKRLLLKGFDQLETSFVGFLGAMGIVLDETRLRFFSYYLWSNILYLSASQDMIRVDLNTDAVPPEFMDAFCREIARMGCFSVGLPEPNLSAA